MAMRCADRADAERCQSFDEGQPEAPCISILPPGNTLFDDPSAESQDRCRPIVCECSMFCHRCWRRRRRPRGAGRATVASRWARKAASAAARPVARLPGPAGGHRRRQPENPRQPGASARARLPATRGLRAACSAGSCGACGTSPALDASAPCAAIPAGIPPAGRCLAGRGGALFVGPPAASAIRAIVRQALRIAAGRPTRRRGRA